MTVNPTHAPTYVREWNGQSRYMAARSPHKGKSGGRSDRRGLGRTGSSLPSSSAQCGPYWLGRWPPAEVRQRDRWRDLELVLRVVFVSPTIPGGGSGHRSRTRRGTRASRRQVGTRSGVLHPSGQTPCHGVGHRVARRGGEHAARSRPEPVRTPSTSSTGIARHVFATSLILWRRP